MATLKRGTSIDPQRVERFLDRLDAEGLELHSFMVARAGAVVAEGWWEPYSADQVHLLYSVSKTFTSSVVGTLFDEGRVDLERPIVEYFPQVTDVPAPFERMTVRHCLTMATGHTADAWFRDETAEWDTPEDPWLMRIFTLPPDSEPGSVFCYNQVATYLLAALVRQLTGNSLLTELRSRILEPLGIGPFYSQASPRGDEPGFTGMHGTTEAVLKLGLLYLNRGVFDGARVLSEEWVELASTSAGIPTSDEEDSDWGRGYGFQMWMSRHGYRADGALGQLALVLPELDAVVATTAEVMDMQALLAAVWEELLPALDGDVAEHDHAELGTRLRDLSIAPLGCDGGIGQRDHWSRGGGDLPRHWAGLSLHPDTDGVTLGFDGADVDVAVGQGHWVHGTWRLGDKLLPVAASGGWSDGEFHADIRVVSSPHVIEVRTHGDTVDIGWRIPPLNSVDPDRLAVIDAPVSADGDGLT